MTTTTTDTTTPPAAAPDPAETVRAAYALHDQIAAHFQRHTEISDKLTAARRTLAALTSPAIDTTVTWAQHWATTEAIETEIADLYQQRADLDPADTEAQACAAHYHHKATTSRTWATEAKAAQS